LINLLEGIPNQLRGIPSQMEGPGQAEIARKETLRNISL
jgi:hypothetical protein